MKLTLTNAKGEHVTQAFYALAVAAFMVAAYAGAGALDRADEYAADACLCITDSECEGIEPVECD